MLNITWIIIRHFGISVNLFLKNFFFSAFCTSSNDLPKVFLLFFVLHYYILKKAFRFVHRQFPHTNLTPWFLCIKRWIIRVLFTLYSFVQLRRYLFEDPRNALGSLEIKQRIVKVKNYSSDQIRISVFCLSILFYHKFFFKSIVKRKRDSGIIKVWCRRIVINKRLPQR